jgi:hypothetical protein
VLYSWYTLLVLCRNEWLLVTGKVVITKTSSPRCILHSDTECISCSQPAIRRMGSKSSTVCRYKIQIRIVTSRNRWSLARKNDAILPYHRHYQWNKNWLRTIHEEGCLSQSQIHILSPEGSAKTHCVENQDRRWCADESGVRFNELRTIILYHLLDSFIKA